MWTWGFWCADGDAELGLWGKVVEEWPAHRWYLKLWWDCVNECRWEREDLRSEPWTMQPFRGWESFGKRDRRSRNPGGRRKTSRVVSQKGGAGGAPGKEDQWRTDSGCSPGSCTASNCHVSSVCFRLKELCSPFVFGDVDVFEGYGPVVQCVLRLGLPVIFSWLDSVLSLAEPCRGDQVSVHVMAARPAVDGADWDRLAKGVSSGFTHC